VGQERKNGGGKREEGKGKEDIEETGENERRKLMKEDTQEQEENERVQKNGGIEKKRNMIKTKKW
jgi:hypothetical protein